MQTIDKFNFAGKKAKTSTLQMTLVCVQLFLL